MLFRVQAKRTSDSQQSGRQAMRFELLLGIIMMSSLTIYVLLAGADYGGGLWDLLSFGQRAEEQRNLIVNAITPVWEANHVWLILVVVLLFSGFPPAFAAVTTALHIPLLILLLGIVFRGTSLDRKSTRLNSSHVSIS